MSDLNRVENLLTSLGTEILIARPGSQEGQFPILDLISNLRDEVAKTPSRARMHASCQAAWERLVMIVESGKPFTPDEIEWLKELLARLQTQAKGSASAGPDSSGDAPLVLNLSSDSALLREFAAESREHLDNIEKGVLVLENQPGDVNTLNTVFRAFHTFKGGSGFLNLVPINELAHVMESLLDLARMQRLVIDGRIIDLILRGGDTLRQFIDEIDGQLNCSRPPQPFAISVAGLKGEAQAIVDAHPAGADQGTQALFYKSAPVESARPEQTTLVKVDTGKLDALLDLVGEMVIAQSLVAGDVIATAGLPPQAARNMAQLARITKDLQRISMSMRLVPIRGAFQKMARVVRDIGVRQGKKVQLLTDGEDTELDRNLVERLTDPLLHMIRNSMDHGIESPEKRVSQGKPATGTIHLGACHLGGDIVIEIRDDGAGLNRERIFDKAIERGLARLGEELSDEDVFGFIFSPGFSTAEKITDLSGRGVGLDVVKKNIEELRGCITASSAHGKGVHFKITLPLTLAIIDGLVVRVGEEQYIIPAGSILESFRPSAGMIISVNGIGEVVNVRGRLIPLLRLYERFALTPASTDPTKCIGIIIQSGASVRCVLVDALIAKQEVVIKNLNELMAYKNRFLAGAAILGDGRVGLILDVNSLVYLDSQRISKAA